MRKLYSRLLLFLVVILLFSNYVNMEAASTHTSQKEIIRRMIYDTANYLDEINEKTLDDISSTNRSKSYAEQYPEIASIARKITKLSDTDYDKALAIHDWISENYFYDKEVINKYFDGNKLKNGKTLPERVYKGEVAFLDDRAICSGISDLYFIMLKCVDVDVVVISGKAIGENESFDDIKGTNHAWNEVYLSEYDCWYQVDVTWDMSNYYEDNTYYLGQANHNYFMIPYEDFSLDHESVQIKRE